VTEYILVLVTAGSETEASTIAKTLVEEQLAACVNLLSPIRSIYRWEGTVTDDQEWLLLVKTRAEHFAAIAARVKALHSYQVPEVIAVPILTGSAAYLQWLHSATQFPASS
jgi:periplasmic divalent cation tolerance protein